MKLSNTTLAGLGGRGIAVPSYPRSGQTAAIGVVHLGLGAFHRAHQALVFDALLRQGDARWGVLGVAMRSTQLADDLAAQDGLYTVQVASSAGMQWQMSGAILRTCVAAREAEQVTAAIAAPHTRWLTLTVTEKGYTPGLAELIVQGLAQRRGAGLPGLTIASCDNLQDNGRQLQALCEAAASQHGTALLGWLRTACTFPNSMVDRIVPAATPARLAAAQAALGLEDRCALGTEAFWEWVIERRFADPADGALLAAQGVTVVGEVRPFETAKLRMLNGSHTAMACLGAVLGLPVISDCIAQPAIHRFIHGMMTEEVGPHLQRQDWPAYRDALLQRFANPELKHSVHQIATDCSLKIPQRWPASALACLDQGQVPQRLAFASAVWLRYLHGVDEAGNAYALNDPMADQLQLLARQHAGDAVATVQCLCSLPELWGTELPQRALWLDAVTRQLERIQTLGLLRALEGIT